MHLCRIVNQYDMAKLFGGAYAKSASVQNAINGFKKPGIWPYDSNVFREEDYAPSTMTDRPYHESSPTSTERPCNNASSTTTYSSYDVASSTMTNPVLNDSPVTTTTEPAQPMTETEMSTLPASTLSHDILEEGSANSEAVNHPTSAPNLTPLRIRPIPTMASPKTGRKHKRQKSEVLTSTPVKADQAIKFKKGNNKKTKIAELAGPSKTKKKRSLDKPLNKSPKPDYYCLVCADRYIDPPTEEWIQCDQCKSWAHEDCTFYERIGSYFCDNCQN